MVFVAAVHEAYALVARAAPEVEETLNQERVLELDVVHVSVHLQSLYYRSHYVSDSCH